MVLQTESQQDRELILPLPVESNRAASKVQSPVLKDTWMFVSEVEEYHYIYQGTMK